MRERDPFEYAESNAKEDCAKCGGTGKYQYSTHGTPHFTICDLCCTHGQGVWELSPTCHNVSNGIWCCLAGCGKTWETIEAYKKEAGKEHDDFDIKMCS